MKNIKLVLDFAAACMMCIAVAVIGIGAIFIVIKAIRMMWVAVF